MSVEDLRVSNASEETAAEHFHSEFAEQISLSETDRRQDEGLTDVAQAQTGRAPTGDRPTAAGDAAAGTAVGTTTELTPDTSNIVRLPATASIDDIRIEGANLILVQADGTEIVIANGAAKVPTILLGDVELPQQTFIAALEGNGINVAAGPDGSYSASASPGSSGGDFQDSIQQGQNGPIQLADLLGDTSFGDGTVFGIQQTGDDQPTVRGTVEQLFGAEDTDEEGGFATLVLPGRLDFDPGNQFGTVRTVSLDGSVSSGGIPVDTTFVVGGTAANPVLTLTGTITVVTDGVEDVVTVFTLVVTDVKSGTFTFTLLQPLDHSGIGSTGADDVLNLPFAYTVQDKSGDPVPGKFAIQIADDGPTAVPGNEGNVHDEALTSGNVEGQPTASISNVSLNIHWGADSANAGGAIDRTVTFTNENVVVSGGYTEGLTSFGQIVHTIVLGDGTLVGFTGDPDLKNLADGLEAGRVVFHVSLSDEGNGSYAFTLVKPLDHAAGEDQKPLTLTFDYTAKDADGDTASSSFTVSVVDDVPIITQEEIYGATVSESALPAGNPDQTSNNPVPLRLLMAAGNGLMDGGTLGIKWGADNGNSGNGGAGDISVAFSDRMVGAEGTHGQALSSLGQLVTTEIFDGVLVGYIGTDPLENLDEGLAAGRVVFHASLSDTDNGSYSFTLVKPLDHAAGEGENTLTLTFKYTATDSDGDKVSSAFKVNIVDDMPVQTGERSRATVDENDLDNYRPVAHALGWPVEGSAGTSPDGNTAWHGGAFVQRSLADLVSFGSDGAAVGGGFSFSFGNNTDATAAVEALNLTSKGDAVDTARLVGDWIMAGTEDRIVFAMRLDGDGTYRFVLLDQLDHPLGDNPETGRPEAHQDIIRLDLSSWIKATDGDDDAITLKDGSVIVRVRDDVPVAIGSEHQTVNENDLSSFNPLYPLVFDFWQGSLGTSPYDGNSDGSVTGLFGTVPVWGSLADNIRGGADERGAFHLVNEQRAERLLASLAEDGYLTSKGQDINDARMITIEGVGDAMGFFSADGRLIFGLFVGENGTYNFRLFDQLDHSAQGADTLDIDLSRFVHYTDFDGDTINLGKGLFVITVVDDVPEVIGSKTITLDEDDLGNLLSPANALLLAFRATVIGSNGTDQNPTGALDTVMGTTSANGLLNEIIGHKVVNGGADEFGHFGLISETAAETILGNAGWSSNGSPITDARTITIDGVGTVMGFFAEDGRLILTLSLTAGPLGAYDVRLWDQFDHAGHDNPATADITETAFEDVLALDLGQFITYTDADGDKINLDGSVKLNIVDDIPVATGHEIIQLNEADLGNFLSPANALLLAIRAVVIGSNGTDQNPTGALDHVMGTTSAAGVLNEILGNRVVNGGADEFGRFGLVSEANAETALANAGWSSNGSPITDARTITIDGVGTVMGFFAQDGRLILTLSLTNGPLGAYDVRIWDQFDHAGHDDPATVGVAETAFADVLHLDLGQFITYTDADGDKIGLGGHVTLNIVDDIPELVAGATVVGTVEEEDGTLTLDSLLGAILKISDMGHGNEDTNSDTPNADKDTAGNIAATSNYAVGVLRGLVKVGADDMGKFSLNAAINGTHVRTADGQIVTSRGENVLYAVTTAIGGIPLIVGYVNSGLAGFTFGQDRVVFSLTLSEFNPLDPLSFNPIDGYLNDHFTFIQHDQLDHPRPSSGATEDITQLDLSATVRFTDADGDSIGLNPGSFVIRSIDDVPVQIIGASPIVGVVEEEHSAAGGQLAGGNEDTSSTPDLDDDRANAFGRTTHQASGNLSSLVRVGADEVTTDVTSIIPLATAARGAFSFGSLQNLPVLFSKGEQVLYRIVEGGNVDTLIGYVDADNDGVADRDVFKLELRNTTSGLFEISGDYKFTLLDQLDHAIGDDPDTPQADAIEDILDIDFSSAINFSDYDGDTITLTPGSFTIKVIDDTPIAKIDLKADVYLTLDETVAGSPSATGDANAADETGAPASPIAGASVIGYTSIAGKGTLFTDTSRGGTDEIRSTVYSLKIGNGGATGMFDAQTNEAITLTAGSGALAGKVIGATATGTIVFVVDIDAATGATKVWQYRAVEHDNPADGDESGTSAVTIRSGSLAIEASVTDYDGDRSTASADLGNRIRFEDDRPVASDASTVTVTEKADANGAFIVQTNSGTLPFYAGTDGARITNIAYTLGSKILEPGEGNNDPESTPAFTSGGHPVTVTTSLDGLTVTGTVTVGNITSTVFTLSVTNAATGAYSFTQNAPIDHPDKGESGAADVLRMVFDFTVTDGDGDTSKGKLRVDIRDDAPTASNGGAVTVTEDASPNGAFIAQSAGGTLSFEGGADRAVVTNIAYRFGSSIMEMGEGDSDPMSFPALTSGGHPVTVTTAANGLTVTGTITVGGVTSTVFTLSVTNAATGAYSFTQNAPIDHPDKGESGAADSLRMVFDYTVTDGDGDTSKGWVQVDIRDDAPTASNGGTVTVTEDAGPNGAFIAQSAGGTLSFEGGADRAVVTNIAYRFGGSIMEMGEGDSDPMSFPALTSGGHPVTVTTAANGLTVTGTITVGGVTSTVFTLSVTNAATGAYSFTQNAPIDHPDKGESGAADSLRMVFDYTVTDGDGDTSKGWVQVDIRDDAPTMHDNHGMRYVTLSENDIASGATASWNYISGSKLEYGADGFGSSAFTGAIKLELGPGSLAGNVSLDLTKGVKSTSKLTSDGKIVMFELVDAQTIQGYTLQGGVKTPVIELKLIGSTVTTTLLAPLDHFHAESGKPSETITIDADMVFKDGDGDAVTSTIRTTIVDSVPTITGTAQKANLLANGNFSDGTWGHQESWGHWTTESIGWKIDGTVPGQQDVRLERVSDGYLGMQATGHSPMIDLGATPGNVAISQNVSGLTAGEIYSLTFEVGSPDAASSKLEVYWNGQRVDTIQPTGTMQGHTVSLVAVAGANVLTFKEVGNASDNTGTFLANVSLTQGADLPVFHATTNEDDGVVTINLAGAYSFGADTNGTVIFDTTHATIATPNGTIITLPSTAYHFDQQTGFLTIHPGLAFEGLSKGEIALLTIRFTVTDGDGDARSAVYQLKITGNDDPVTTAAGTPDGGTITEYAENDAGAGSTIVRTQFDPETPGHPGRNGGTFHIYDDQGDTHVVTVSTPNGSSYLGTVTAVVTEETANDGAGIVSWKYNVTDAALNPLGAGEEKIETFTITVTDNHGNSSSRDITVTLVGTNDKPVITSTDAQANATLYAGGGLDHVKTADLASNNKFELDQNIDTRIAALLESNPTDMHAVLSGVQVALGHAAGMADAIAAVWDYVDDHYSYHDTAINAVGVRLALEYADYIKAGGEPLTTVFVKYTPDGVDTGTAPDRVQSMHDNLLGNLHLGSIDDKFLPHGGGGSNATPNVALHDALVAAITAAGLSGRPIYSGDEGTDPSASNAWDIAHGLLPGGYQQAVSGQLTATDIDLHDQLTWSLDKASTPYGTMAIDAATGKWTYTLDNSLLATRQLEAGAVRTETFVATVSDGHGGSATQTITVTIHGTNDAPVVSGAVTGTAIEGGSASILNALANASDVDHGAVLSVVNVPANLPAGVTYDAATHSFTLDPTHNSYDVLAVGATTTVTVNYAVTDGTAVTPASVSWVITGTNDAPVITIADNTQGHGTLTGYEEEDGSDSYGSFILKDLDISVSDIDSSTYTKAVIVLSEGESGDKLNMFTTDSQRVVTGGVQINYTTQEVMVDGVKTITMTLFGSKGEALTAAQVEAAIDLVRFHTGDRVSDATPDRHIEIKVYDHAGLASSAAKVTLDVTGTNDTPTWATNPSPLSATIAEDGRFSLNVFTDKQLKVGDRDGDDDATLTLHVGHGKLTVSDLPAGVTITGGFNGSDTITLTGPMSKLNDLMVKGSGADRTSGITYVANPDANGPDQLTLTFNDNGDLGLPASADAVTTIAINVTPVNDAPVANNDTLSSIAEDSCDRIISFASLLGNDSKGPANESGQTLTITQIANVVGGTAVIEGTNIRFTPALNFNGTASFEYTVQDNGQTNGVNDFKTDVGVVSFTVTPVNDLPVVGTISNFTVDEDGVWFVSKGVIEEFINNHVSDVETKNDDLFFKVVVGNKTVAEFYGRDIPNGISYQLPANYFGTLASHLEVFDGTDKTVREFDVIVNSVNDNPSDIIWNAVYPSPEASLPGKNDVLAKLSVVDVDSAGHFKYNLLPGSNPNIAIDPNTGVVTTTSKMDAGVTYKIAVEVTDGDGGRHTKTFTVRTGTGDDDDLDLTGGDHIVYASRGDDAITGGPGNDTIFGQGGEDTLEGGDGDDALYGQGAEDTIFGGNGNDFISGGSAKDTLTGGAGADTFAWGMGGVPGFGDRDTITDYSYDEGDVIDLSSLFPAVTGSIGNYIHVDRSGASIVVEVRTNGNVNSNSWKDAYILEGDTSQTVRILVGNKTYYFKANGSVSEVADPIILDLDHNGVAFSSIDNGVSFDINADGHKDNIAWTSTDGILAYDLDGNGGIDNGSEIFTPSFNGGGHASGIAALATLDSNGDGKIDAEDDAFSKLSIWVDANHNGISDDGELSGLLDHSIRSISLDTTANGSTQDGQAILSEGHFTLSDGSTGNFLEVGFETLLGGQPDHVVTGGEGNDVLVGGPGFTQFTGGAGADTFVLDPAALQTLDMADVVTDYKIGEGDVLDVSRLLDTMLGHQATEQDATTGIRATITGNDTTISVQVDDGWKDVAVLQNHTEAVRILFDDKNTIDVNHH